MVGVFFALSWIGLAGLLVVAFIRQRRTPIDRRYREDLMVLVLGMSLFVLSCGGLRLL